MRRALLAYAKNRHLFGFSVGELYAARLPTIALSLVTTPAVMGSFGAVTAAFQAMGGVVQSALQVPMVARARTRLGIDDARHSPLFSVAVALVAALPMAAVVALIAPFLTGTVLKLPDRQAALWLMVFMLALPFMAVTRALVFNRIGDGRYGWAMRAIALLAVPRFGALGAAGATAAAELVTAATLLGVAAVRSRRKFE
jgi:O-antigen/teichoic acid export membrane protein